MRYCIITDNIITNIIVCASDEIAAQFGAVPSYDGARIGDPYDPPPEPEPEPPAPTLDERVTALETEKASQADVDELNEALNMILTGYTGEEGTDEAGTEG